LETAVLISAKSMSPIDSTMWRQCRKHSKLRLLSAANWKKSIVHGSGLCDCCSRIHIWNSLLWVTCESRTFSLLRARNVQVSTLQGRL